MSSVYTTSTTYEHTFRLWYDPFRTTDVFIFIFYIICLLTTDVSFATSSFIYIDSEDAYKNTDSLGDRRMGGHLPTYSRTWLTCPVYY